ncbi:Uncharacterized protein Fot_31656 [Forsythia ovata]|uniref:Uncharacterized protein n=1 Tax=Forsythia ovata TaxID=205694 RepID=A0ABD1T5K7_9LAMI
MGGRVGDLLEMEYWTKDNRQGTLTESRPIVAFVRIWGRGPIRSPFISGFYANTQHWEQGRRQAHAGPVWPRPSSLYEYLVRRNWTDEIWRGWEGGTDGHERWRKSEEDDEKK